jgi:hypothetical protein
MRFSTSGFFHESTPYDPQIHTLKYFWTLFQIRADIRIQKLFPGFWYSVILCSAGSDTLQDFVPRGVVLWDIRPRRTSIFYKMYTIRHCSAGPDTKQDLVPWGLIPYRILFGRVWYSICQSLQRDPFWKLFAYETTLPNGTIFNFQYLRELETELENILGYESGPIWGQFMKKTRGRRHPGTVALRTTGASRSFSIWQISICFDFRCNKQRCELTYWCII